MLFLSGRLINDLSDIVGMTGLQFLSFNRTLIADLSSLSDHPNLRGIDLGGRGTFTTSTRSLRFPNTGRTRPNTS